MILDLPRFLQREQPGWRELERLLDRCQPGATPLGLDDWDRLRHLYARSGWALHRLRQSATAPDIELYLSRLLARSYGELNHDRDPTLRRLDWGRVPALLALFPIAFRRHARLFALALAVFLLGALFGGLAVAHDPVAVSVLLPDAYLAHPAQRVSSAQNRVNPLLTSPNESAFAAQIMTHNIQTAIFGLLLGVTLGLGTALLLFTNGILLGAVIVHYGTRGFGVFVAAWLLPHGVVEIPALLVGGQGGFLLASALLRPDPLGPRSSIRRALPDLITLTLGLSVMLVWSGLVEAFYSQYSSRALYTPKVVFGIVELLALAAFLFFGGQSQSTDPVQPRIATGRRRRSNAGGSELTAADPISQTSDACFPQRDRTGRDSLQNRTDSPRPIRP